MTRFALISPLAAVACAPAPIAEDVVPEYLGIETTVLEFDLIQFTVAVDGTDNKDIVENYAQCAAAGYALDNGNGFARHLRTNIYKEGGAWTADAVYTISPTLPDGLVIMDAEVIAAACEESGIPMV